MNPKSQGEGLDLNGSNFASDALASLTKGENAGTGDERLAGAGVELEDREMTKQDKGKQKLGKVAMSRAFTDDDAGAAAGVGNVDGDGVRGRKENGQGSWRQSGSSRRVSSPAKVQMMMEAATDSFSISRKRTSGTASALLKRRRSRRRNFIDANEDAGKNVDFHASPENETDRSKSRILTRQSSASMLLGRSASSRRSKWRSKRGVQDSGEDVDEWSEEAEFSLIQYLQRAYFQARNLHVVFLSKVLKRREGNRGGAGKEQLLVVSQLRGDNGKNDLIFHRVNLKGSDRKVDVRESLSLRRLQVVDGDPNATERLPTGVSKEPLLFSLHFESSRPYLFYALSEVEKAVLQWCLIQLCQQFLHYLPKLTNINRYELGLMASQGGFERRCPLLMASSRRDADDDEEEDEYFTGDEDATKIANGIEARGHGNAVSLDDPIFHHDQSNESLSNEEQAELFEILNQENMDELNAGELSAMLLERIDLLEQETGDELRSWENRVDRPRSASNLLEMNEKGIKLDIDGNIQGLGTFQDPIATLVEKLEGVEMELSDLDVWMSNYNMELRGMRKGIHKIENENNRLQLKSRNHELLRLRLKALLQRYELDEDTRLLISEIHTVLHVDLTAEVENGVPCRGEQPAMDRLMNAAKSLTLAMRGESPVSPNLVSSTDRITSNLLRSASVRNDVNDVARRIPQEEHFLAVEERIREISEEVDKFCGHLEFHLSDRVKSLSGAALDRFLNNAPLSEVTGFPMLRDLAAEIHRKLSCYKSLVQSLRELNPDGYFQFRNNYIKDMGTMYTNALRGFFAKLKASIQPAEFFESKLSSMPDCVIGGYHQDKEEAQKIVNRMDPNSERPTGAVALRHCLSHVIELVLKEQDFVGEFFWELEKCNYFALRTSEYSEEGKRSKESSGKKMVQSSSSRKGPTSHAEHERDMVLETFFVKNFDVVGEIEEKIIKPVRASSNHYEILSMVVDVESTIAIIQGYSEFLTNTITNPSKGLHAYLQTSFTNFINAQITWIDNLHPNSKYCGVLVPFRRFPAFVDRILAVWNRCAQARRNNSGGDNPVTPTEVAEFARNSVGLGLQKIASILLQWLERTANQQPKYALIVMMENLYFFYKTVGERQNHDLQRYVDQAEKLYETTIVQYVAHMIESQYPRLVTFVLEVTELLTRMTPNDVVYHKPREDINKTVSSITASSIRDGLPKLSARIKKHISNESRLRFVVARNIATTLAMHYNRYEGIMHSCYGETIEPSYSQVSEWIDEEFNTPDAFL